MRNIFHFRLQSLPGHVVAQVLGPANWKIYQSFDGNIENFQKFESLGAWSIVVKHFKLIF
uniref:Uncharacterized protein n=1 Tax=Rhizophora mucronata TaxID=61149 RepID=A0A2P2MY00_RHIMU